MTALAQLLLQGEGVALRRAVADDVPAIVDLLAADELGARRDGISTEGDLDAYLAAFHQIDADPGHLLLVATESSHVVATMQLTFLPGSPDGRRCGPRSRRSGSGVTSAAAGWVPRCWSGR